MKEDSGFAAADPHSADVGAPVKWRSDQPPPFEGDEDGYPTDEWLEALRLHVMDFHAASRFLLTGFPEAVQGIACCGIAVSDVVDSVRGPSKEINFWTGGWSGAEALIATMLQQFAVRHFYSKWERGGLYTFQVPLHFLAEGAPTASTASAAANPRTPSQ